MTKNIILAVYLILIILFISLVTFYSDFFSFNNLSNYIEEYNLIKQKVNNHLFFSCIIYCIVATLWILLFGITSILLLVSISIFGYLSCFLNILTFTLGSTLAFKISCLYKDKISTLLKNRFIIRKNTFEFYVLFRLIPGVPFFIKNLSAIFFNLTTKKFVSATLIAETPQIIFFSYFIKSFLNSTEKAISSHDLKIIYEQMFLPLICLLLFLLVLFYIKYKIWGKETE